MSVNAGDIKITLTMDGRDFNVTVRDSERLLRQLKGSVDNTAQSVERIDRHFGSFFTSFRHGMQMIAAVRFALMDVNDAILSMPAAIMKSAGEFERMTKLMGGFSREAAKAAREAEGAANVRFAFNLATNNPFDVKSITAAMVKFKAVGLDPANGSMQSLLDGMAEFGGNSEQLNRVSIALQQMVGKGVISMEELRQQLGEHMPTAMQAMASAAGISVAELTYKVSKGTVEARSAINLMLAEFRMRSAGAGTQLMETWVGGIARASTEWEKFKIAVGNEAFFSETKDALKEIVQLMQTPEARKFAYDLGTGFGAVVRTLVDMANGLRQNWELITNLGTAVVTLWSASMITSLLGGISRALRENLAASGTLRVGIIANQIQIDTAYMVSARVHAQMSAQIVADKARLAAAEHLVTTRRIEGRFASAADMALEQARINQLRESIALNTANAVAVARSAAIKRTLGSAVGFLLGPMGTLITTLSIGVGLWQLWGDNAAEAFNKIRRAAAAGQGTQEMVDTANKALKETQDKITRIQLQLDGRGGLAPAATGEYRKKLEAELEALKATMRTQQAAKNDVIGNMERQAVEERVSNFQREFQERERIAADKYNIERDALKRSLEDKNLTKQEFDKQTAAGEKQIRDREIASRIAAYKEEEQAARLRGMNLTGIDKEVQKRRESEARKQRQQLEEMGRTLDTGLQTTPKKSKKEKAETSKPLLDPFSRMLATAKAEMEKLEEQVDHLSAAGTDVIETYDSVYARVRAKIQEQADQGVFTRQVKGKDGTTTAVERTDDELEQLMDIQARNEMLKKQEPVLKSLVDKQNDLNRAEKESLDLVAAGGIELKTSQYRQLENFFADLRTKIELSADQLVKFEAVKKRALGQQSMIDINAMGLDMQSKGKDLFAQLGETDRENQERRFSRELSDLRRHFEAKLVLAKADALARGVLEEEVMNRTKAAREAFNQYVLLLTEKQARDTETPLQKMARDWKDVTGQMRSASVGWANQTVDAIIQMVKTGKFEFSKLAESILTDIARIQLQNRVADPMSKLMDTGIDNLVKMFTRGGSGGQFVPNDSTGLLTLPGEFADGGIMTRHGRAQLRKYEKGGIAHSPQLAMFGEGSKPEAYVPLPDGRSIPVTMNGGNNITLNVINQTNTPVAAHTQQRMDGKELILDVVLSAAHQPGPFRDGLKQAVGT